MLSTFFKPAWKSRSVEKRLRAISAMDGANPEYQEILAQMAADDADTSICVAAIHKLTSIAAVHEISMIHSNNSARAEASKRVDELMSDGSSLNKEPFSDVLNRYPELTVRLAAQAIIDSVRTEAVQRLSTDQLLEVLDLTVYSDSRQQIAERLSDIEALESARKTLRGKDKNAERILKTKIDEFRCIERQHAENIATVNKLTDEVEYLASHIWRAEFKAQLLTHQKRWDNLEFEINPESLKRYQTARKIIDSRYEEKRIIDETHLSQKNLVVELKSFLQIIKNRNLDNSIDELTEMTGQVDQFDSSWQKLAIKIRPDRVINDQYNRMVSALQSTIQLIARTSGIVRVEDIAEPDKTTASVETRAVNKLADDCQQLSSALKNLKWPSAFGELQLAIDMQQQLSDWRKAEKTAATEREQKLAHLHKKISSIFRFSRSGNLARAKQVCEKVEKALNHFEGKDRQALDDRFEEACIALGKMDDWKNFATEPKYIELCEKMEHLAESGHHPDKLSREIKELQQRWKQLGHSDISDQYWSRFKEAADKVYQPCADFFKQRHRSRKVNLQQRQQYVEQMRELFEKTDWDDDPDYKSAQSSMRNISDKFAGIKDVERAEGQKQWKKFSRLKDDVYAKLNVAYETNISLKRQLIKQTETLAEANAGEENLARLKTLQTRWKQIGVTRRNEDQKAWTEFKTLGDLVYNKVQQLRQGQRDETDQQLNTYWEIIKDIQKLVSTARDLAQADQLFTNLQDKYTDLPELPKQLPEKLVAGIQRDYRKACDLFDSSRLRIIDRMRSEQIKALRMKANLCALQEALGESPNTEKLQLISQQWNAIDLHDLELSRRIEKRRDSIQTSVDRVDIAAKRRMLCIKLEIAVGKESPAEDKALRMNYQLEQMKKSGLGQQAVNNTGSLEKLELDWLCMPGAEPQQQKEFDDRFQQILRSQQSE